MVRGITAAGARRRYAPSAMAGFIGREREVGEIAALARALTAADAAPAVFAMTGEPGVGKSRLLSEAVAIATGARSAAAPIHVVRVTGYEPERTVPLASAQPILGTLLPADAPRPSDRLALFEATHRGLQRRAGLVLAVDDLQWVDEHSLALLHYLARGASTDMIPLGMMLASRPSPRSAAFVAALERLLGPAVRSVELRPLQAGDAVELARRLGAGEHAEDVSRRAGGSPFWIEVLAREAAGGLAEPEGVGQDARRVVTDRLTGASGDAIELVALLTIAGRPLAAADASDVLDWPSTRVEAALRELTDAGVARSGLAGAALVHDLVREAVAAGITTATRTRLHRALSRHLEAAAGSDARLLWEALEHRLAAGEPGVELALRIASAPSRRLLGLDVVAELGRIADLHDTGRGREQRTARRLHRAVATLATELGAHELALTRWEQIVDRSPEGRARAEAALAACREAIMLRDRRARRLLTVAQESIDPEREPRLAIIADAIEAGVVRWLEGDLDAARVPAWRALEAARRRAAAGALDASEREAYLLALQAASDAAMAGMQRSEMLALATEMRTVAGEARDRAVRLQSSWQQGVAEYMSGQLHEAETTLRHVWDEAGRLVLPVLRAEAGYWLGYSLLDLGLAIDARDVLREAAALLDRTGGHLKFNNRIALPLGVAELLTGAWRDGLRLLEADAASLDDPHVRLRVTVELAKWRARLDGPASAPAVIALVESALRDAAAASCRRCTQEAEVVCADAAAIVGDETRAAAALARWEQLRPVEANLFERLHAARARALVERHEDAVRSLRSGIAEADSTDQRLEAAWSLITVADLVAAGDPEAARGALRRAATLAAESGMATLESVARQRARLLGVREWRRSVRRAIPVGDGALTAREREVAEHIAAGESNAEIAAALFLSPRTVDRHVENLLHKLRVPNRAAVVAALRMGSPADDGETSGSIASR
jgi:DNA-binding NarL/FixJ family response regulator